MKKIKVILSLGIVAIGLKGVSQLVSAEEIIDRTHSTADVEYILNRDPTLPTDPTDPGNEIKPNPSNPGTNNPGPLSIDYVSNIHFGQQKAYGNDTYYYAEIDAVINNDGSFKDVPNYLQITDNRGSNAGWSLSVKQEGQFINDNQKRLGKAELSLFNGTPNSKNSLTAMPIANQTITLKLDGAGNGINSNVLLAEAGQGNGTWTNMFGKTNEIAKESVELFVPGGTFIEEGAYQTSLIWTLSADPAQ